MSASVERVPGVLSADLNFASATLLVEYEVSAAPLDGVVRAVEATGHGISPLVDGGDSVEVRERPWVEKHLAEIATVGSGVFSAVGAVLGRTMTAEWASAAAFAVAIAFGGALVWRRALNSLKVRVLDMNVLMSAAVFGAAALGEWGEGATVFFLFALGGLLESRSLERTRRSIRDLMSFAPVTARVRRGSEFKEVPTSDVAVGETVVVRPGERIPLDAVVTGGASAVDESAITGESAPADKVAGDVVFGGTLNTTGVLECEVTAASSDSTLARIVFLVEEAQAARAPSQRLVDRFSRVYTPAVIALAVAVAVVPPLVGALTGMDLAPPAEWIRRALIVLVVSCPCALVISTPVSIVSAITRASRDGVLVKGGAFLEIAARVKVVAFDKTGTLSHGRPEVARVVPLAGATAEQVLLAAAALEAHSNHPAARAIIAAVGETDVAAVDDLREWPGRGVSGHMGGVRYEVCSPARARETSALDPAGERAVVEIEESGMTALVVVADGFATGVIGVADAIRAEAVESVARLHTMGMRHLVMLTGDNQRVADAVARGTGLTDFRAGLLPEQKAGAVKDLRQEFGVVAMVGDGVNDAPALAAADIGIAMGAAGSDTALETADVALMRDDLSAISGFLSLGRRTMRVIVQNVAFSIGVKVVFLALALSGRATLWMAVFADTGVSLLVILNGMRLLRRVR